jgi:hypothetical protein
MLPGTWRLLSTGHEKIPLGIRYMSMRNISLLAILKASLPQPLNKQHKIVFHVFTYIWYLQIACESVEYYHNTHTTMCRCTARYSTVWCFQSVCISTTVWYNTFSTSCSPLVHLVVNISPAQHQSLQIPQEFSSGRVDLIIHTLYCRPFTFSIVHIPIQVASRRCKITNRTVYFHNEFIY